jgi:hypothetical protein
MKKLLFVLVLIGLISTSALGDGKEIILSSKQLLKIELLLKSKGYNVKVIKGSKIVDMPRTKEGDITSTILVMTYNIDNRKEGVYWLNYKKDKLINILNLER